MKVKVKWIDAFAVACGNLLATNNIKEFELDSLIELEATPVELGYSEKSTLDIKTRENDNITPLRLCKSFEDHKNNREIGIECDCFKPKKLKRLHSYEPSIDEELDQIYTAINELRKDAKF